MLPGSRQIFPIAVVLGLTLTGCQAFKQPEQEVSSQQRFDEQLAAATESIKNAQLELYQAGVLNETPGNEPIDLSDEGKLISISWQGDAEQLLEKIAKDSKREFSSLGVKLPLPVNVDVKDVPLNHVISQVQAQVGYRAVVSYTPTEITLHYNKP